MPQNSIWINCSPERIDFVINEISVGSEPALRFYIMVVISTLIASIGLLTNSTAVIIGAMLVAPLMTPIFGITLGLLLGRPDLLGYALRAEIMGVLLAVSIALLFGFLPLQMQVTPEMMARTHPNLLDLLVAIFAGLAGSYALVDERLSPSLPGVAIATAIVPPLANTGLCLSVGSYDGASGSFLLFLANFVSILLVAAVVFISAGMVPRLKWGISQQFARRFGLAILGFCVIVFILTKSLLNIIQYRRITQIVNQTLELKIADLYGASLERAIFKPNKEMVEILATIRTPRVIEPGVVEIMEKSITQSLDMPVKLIVRSILSTDVGAPGSNVKVIQQNLNGKFLEQKNTEKDIIIQISEQILREQLSYLPTFKLRSVEYVNAPRGGTVVANIESYRKLYADEIQSLEQSIRSRLGHYSRIDANRINLIITLGLTQIFDDRGPILPGWSVHGQFSENKQLVIDQIEKQIKKLFTQMNGIYPVHFYYNLQKLPWKVLIETVGNRVVVPKEIEAIEKQLNLQLQQPVTIQAWSRIAVLVNQQGYKNMEAATELNLDTWEKDVLQQTRKKAVVSE